MIAVGLVILSLSSAATAEVIVTPVRGYIELDSDSYTCSWGTDNICHPCVNDADVPDEQRLMLAFGVTSPTSRAYGRIAGTVSPFVEIDGVTVTPDLLPSGSFFRVGLYWQDYFVPPACGNGDQPGVTYSIGAVASGSVQRDGVATIDIPKEQASLIAFEISFCNQFVYLGSGCGIAGSATNRWRLHMPQALQAYALDAGDAPPLAPSGMGITVDLLQGPGGTLTVTRGESPPPVGPPLEGAPGYWEVNTDMPAESFSALVDLEFATADLPPGITPEELTATVFDPVAGDWRLLPTTVDAASGTATAMTNQFGVLALATVQAVPTQAVTWSALKAIYSQRPPVADR
jgi:hypothetical protein